MAKVISEKEVRYGIIDLGSNTARLVVMLAIPGYAYRLEDEVREVVRLRHGMNAAGLSEEAMTRAFSALRLFTDFCAALNVDVLIPTATSAVREAGNGPAFVARVKEELGITLQILDGEREAYLGTIGALNDVDAHTGFVLDIGGGSAQISRVENQRYVRGQSALLGALALTEEFITTDPISKREFKLLQSAIERRLERFAWLPQPGAEQTAPELVGLGGTIRNLAKREAARRDYPLNTLHGFYLTAASVAQTIEELCERDLAGRCKLSGLRRDRADIILPGAMVVAAVMARLGVDGLTISTNGLREGIFFEQFWQHLAYPVVPDVRSYGVLNLARIYRYQKSHANHVRFLARRSFDQLRPLHEYGPPERELLDAAALLHDIGTVVNYNDHHLHSQMLIVSNGLPGFTPREIALIALLTHYHRKGEPSVDDYAALLSKDDKRLLLQTSAILRLAEYLERGRCGAVDDVIITWTDDELRVTLVADVYPAVEMWQTERYAAPLLSAAFGRTILFDSTAAPTPMPVIA